MSRQRISEAALLVGYAMSRLDRRSLELLGCSTWETAFNKAGKLIGDNPLSIKGIRDEFDPFFDNTRRGWVDRPARQPIIALLHEMEAVSDGALEALTLDALSGRRTAVDAVREVIAAPPERLINVGERLRTGALAERFFVEHCHDLVNVRRSELIDTRLDACGYDFTSRHTTGKVFEVKGLAASRGGLLFTDLEWQTARRLKRDYWLIVVSDVASAPQATVLVDPTEVLPARMIAESRLTISWRAPFAA